MGRWLALALLLAASPAAADPTPLRDIAQLSVGEGHVCGVTTNGAVVCWGDNAAGQAGIDQSGKSMPTEVTRPHVVGGLPTMRSVTAGSQHTCAISKADRVWCWGSAGGDLKISEGGTSGSIELKGAGLGTPVEMPLGDGKATALALHHRHACAAFETDVRCWQTLGAIPIGAKTIAKPKLAIAQLAGATALAMGHGKTCAITPKNLYCWREGLAPSAVAVRGAVSISMGEMYACVRSVTGDARCWFSLIDDFWKRPHDKVIQWPGRRKLKAIAAGESPICTVDITGGVDCFLSDEQGLPDQAVEASWATTKLEAHPIKGVGNAIDVGLGKGRDAFGYGFGCALRGDRTVVCWGDNEHGQLGRGTTKRDKTAAPVLAP